MYIKNSRFENMGFQSINRLSSKAVEGKLQDGSDAIAYVNTIVAKKLPNGDIVLNTDGRHTITSKKRINKFINPYGYNVYQKNFKRYVTHGANTFAYNDNIILCPQDCLHCMDLYDNNLA